MTEPANRKTLVTKILRASRKNIYRACIDPEALARWRVPDDMTAHVHSFDAREGGKFQITLTYRNSANSPGGKTTSKADIFQGRFLELTPDRKIVELIEFEADDPAFTGEMKITTHLVDTKEGTEIAILCEYIPTGIRLEDNELGCRESLRKLAMLVERAY